MSRWRRYSTGTWDKPWFRALSAAAPNGQTLYTYLVTGPSTTAIPGLIQAGEAALSEALRWSLPGFRKAFREIQGQELAQADWNARLVWMPSLLADATPESPNVLRAWRTALEEIPPCELADEVRAAVEELVAGLTEPFRKAFAEGSRKTFRKTFANKKQEAEAGTEHRKQEKEQDSPPLPPHSTTTSDLPSTNGHVPRVSRHFDPWKARQAGGAP
jgi:hypothetical protein